jgi:hypothetical protein
MLCVHARVRMCVLSVCNVYNGHDDDTDVLLYVKCIYLGTGIRRRNIQSNMLWS